MKLIDLILIYQAINWIIVYRVRPNGNRALKRCFIPLKIGWSVNVSFVFPSRVPGFPEDPHDVLERTSDSRTPLPVQTRSSGPFPQHPLNRHGDTVPQAGHGRRNNETTKETHWTLVWSSGVSFRSFSSVCLRNWTVNKQSWEKEETSPPFCSTVQRHQASSGPSGRRTGVRSVQGVIIRSEELRSIKSIGRGEKNEGEQLGRLFLSLVLLSFFIFYFFVQELKRMHGKTRLYFNLWLLRTSSPTPQLLLCMTPLFFSQPFIFSQLLDFQCIKSFLLPLKKKKWNPFLKLCKSKKKKRQLFLQRDDF